MLKDQFRIALRSLRRQKGYVFLNVGGLAVALASTAIILLYVRDELSYDRFHEGAERIYTLNASYQYSESMRLSLRGMPSGMAQTLEDELAGVEHAIRWGSSSVQFVDVGDLDGKEQIRQADPEFFQVFNFKLLRGDPETALEGPSSLVLTPEMATAYFGTADPVGRTLATDDGKEYVITGIVEAPPHNTEFSFSFIGRYPDVAADELAKEGGSAWNPIGQVDTYVRLAAGFSPDQFLAMMPDFLARHMGTFAEGFEVVPERLVDQHLYRTRGGSGNGLYGDIKYVWMFSGIAALILLIACINYTNLATARSLKRAREVGVRKAVGAGRGQLMRRFLGESVIMCGLATLVAILLVDRGLPAFSRLTGKEIGVDWLADPFVIPGFIILTLLVSLLAGAYPAAVLSRFQPILALRGSAGAGSTRGRIRKFLVTFQFVISATLIVCTLVMVRQLRFMQNSDLGLEPDQIVSVSLPYEIADRYPVFRDEYQRVPNVLAVTGGDLIGGGYMIIFEDDAPTRPTNGAMRTIRADHNYVQTLGIELLEGRNFEDTNPAENTVPALLNQAAVADLGFDDPIGQVIRFAADSELAYEVVGVVKDFHFQSLREAIDPVMIVQNEDELNTIYVRIGSSDVPETLTALEDVWSRIEPSRSFNHAFLDERFARMYENDRRTETLFTLAAAFAIFVSCLGLFGLAAYAAEQRTREIGIRKVLGASVSGIVGLLSREFLLLVGVAFVFAAPLAWFVMDHWLEEFAYRITIGPGIFLLAAFLAAAVALVSIIGQAIRAAAANPVESIRYE